MCVPARPGGGGAVLLDSDRVWCEQELVMQRDQYFCLVDEADSILIDEARTPLIISKPGDPPRDKYGVAVQVANFLRRDVHYSVDEKAQVRTKLPMY